MWNLRELHRDGKLIASAKWRAIGDCAELHNEVYDSRKSSLLWIRKEFEAIKDDVRKAGLDKIVVLSDRHDKKMQKYWEFMGFEYFGHYEGLPYGVMGV